ncbi:MAG: PAS domain S-box protein [Desulfobacterales bacterium]|nr:PAS domain S-box protein [Desulfobacterales bacterium]
MTDEKKNIPRSLSNATSFHEPSQIHEQAEQKAKSMHLSDIDAMTREEIRQIVHEMQVKQLEANLHAEQLSSQLEKTIARAELSTALDALSAHLAITNEAGTITAVNSAWRQFAHSNAAILSKTGEGVNYFDICDNAIGPDAENAAEFAKGMRAVLDGGKTDFAMEYPCHSSTEQRWFIGRVTRFAANEETRLVVVHENITMRKQAEELLRESEERFKTMFRESPVSIIVHDKKTGEIVDANEAAYTAYGFSSLDELKANEFWLDSPYSAKEALDWIHKTVSEGMQRFEWMNRKATGEVFWEQVSLRAVTINGIDRILATSVDITDRKKMEEALQKSEKKFRRLFEGSEEGILVARGGIIEFANPALERVLGYPTDKIVSDPFVSLIHPDDREMVRDRHFRRMQDQPSEESYEFRAITSDGTVKWIHINAQLIDWDDTPATLSFLHDITDRKHAEQRLMESEERMRGITESTGDAIIMMDNQGAISFWNPAATEILGYRPEEAIGQDLHEMLAPERYHEAVKSNLPAFLETGWGNLVGKKLELSALNKNGHEIAVALTLSAVFLQGQWHAVGVLRDITEQKNMEKDLTRLADTDDLTGLFNRRVFLERLAHEISRCKRYGKAAVLMMLDLDHFKKVNDTYGHAGGDMVLREFARILMETVRETDVSGRMGGEEFAVLLPETTIDAAMPVARRILHLIRESAVVIDGEEIRFTASIGLAQVHADDTHPEPMLARADAAMYQAKDKGRDRAEIKN